MTPKKNSSVSHSGARDRAETVEGADVADLAVLGIVIRVRRMAALQVVTVELQQAESRHHAEERRQVQKVVEADRRQDRNAEQANDDAGAALDPDLFVQGFWHLVRYREIHDRGRHRVVDDRRHEQREESGEFDMAGLPDHQRRYVAERRKRTAGIRGDDDVDTAEADESIVTLADRHDHGAHDQRGRQVVDDRRKKKTDDAGNDEQLAETEAALHEPGPEALEHASLRHRIDIGHRRQQEQEQLRKLHQEAADRLLGRVFDAVLRVHQGNQSPDQTGGENHRLRLAQVRVLLGNHEAVCQHEQADGCKADPGRRQVEPFAGHVTCGSRRHGRQQQDRDSGNKSLQGRSHVVCPQPVTGAFCANRQPTPTSGRKYVADLLVIYYD